MKTRHFLLTLLLALISTAAATAQTITTDKRYARGATMAFGRMTVAGISSALIADQGFCYSSENAQPTVDDALTTAYLSNSGRIYWLKELTPATRYHMRGYVRLKSGEVFYGDVIHFYTLPKGTMTYGIRDGGDASARERIRQATERAVNLWNDLTSIQDVYFNVGHNPGTPTADCSYGGYIRVGDNQSYQRTGTILHEMLHGVGVGTNGIWWSGDMRTNGDRGYWLGDRVTEVLRFFDNSPTAQLNGDTQHMWPYGINGAHEDNGTDLLYVGNSLICQALMEDGLQPSSQHFANPYYALELQDGAKYYLKSENENCGFYTSYLAENADGTLSWKEIALSDLDKNDDAAWYVTFTPQNQYYQFRNAKTGHYLYLNGSTAKTNAATSASTDFHLMKARVDAIDLHTDGANPRGYWMLHHAARNPRALAAAAAGKVTTETFNLANSATSQRWLILTAEQAADFDKAGMGAFRAQVDDILNQLRSLSSVPHTEDEAGTDQALADIIAQIEADASSATNAVQVAQLVEKARKAVFSFLANATPSDIDQPFNVSLLIQNPGIDNSDNWVGSPTVSYSCGEYYETSFDFNQTLEGMPAGTYVLRAQAFQRPGRAENAYKAYASGSNTRITTFLYAGMNSERVCNVCDYGQTTALGIGDEYSVGDDSETLYIPNDMHSASAYFARGYYESEVATELKEDDSQLKIGIRSRTSSSYYWSCFDNFRLFYYGSIPLDVVTGIDSQPLAEEKRAEVTAIYNLNGQKVSTSQHLNTSSLPKGIYIVNGKKVVVK